MIDTLILLAAGRGTRLQPLTNDLPKGMVPLHGRPLLEWQIRAARAAGAQRIVIVRGYGAEKIQFDGVEYVTNERFAETNMVASLMEAEFAFGQGFVLGYSDIVYEPQLLTSVLRSKAPIACAVDHDWLGYWEARFGDPLSDAETLRLSGGRIVEIGQPPKTVEEIEGQFVGLVGIQGEGVDLVRGVVAEASALADQGKNLDGGPRIADQLYTTDLLQALIARGHAPVEVPTSGGWLEIDDLSDHALAAAVSCPKGELLQIAARRSVGIAA